MSTCSTKSLRTLTSGPILSNLLEEVIEVFDAHCKSETHASRRQCWSCFFKAHEPVLNLLFGHLFALESPQQKPHEVVLADDNAEILEHFDYFAAVEQFTYENSLLETNKLLKISSDDGLGYLSCFSKWACCNFSRFSSWVILNISHTTVLNSAATPVLLLGA